MADIATIPRPIRGKAILVNDGGLTINAGASVDSYKSSLGPYGNGNVGSAAIVQVSNSIINNGGSIYGTQLSNVPGGLSVIPVPAGAVNLPLGSPIPGALNINTAAESITLPPGNYVASNVNVNFPGATTVTSAGQVAIFVTGGLNLGGNENLNGIPMDLQFFVTGSDYVNINSGGKLFGFIYAPNSHVNVNSEVFGSLIAKDFNYLNSGAAVHFDEDSTCSTSTPSTPPTSPAVPPPQLPPPPSIVGCYLYDANGWHPVECADENYVEQEFGLPEIPVALTV